MIPPEFHKSGRYFRRLKGTRLGQFQVLGERASATNLLRKLIDKNSTLVRTEALGWKHAVPHMTAIPPGLLVVCVVRNAESWALSMHRRPWHAAPALQALGFSEFIRAPWHGIVDRVEDFEEIHPEIRDQVAGCELQYDRHPISGRRFANLFELRRVKLDGLLGMLNRDCNLMLVTAETVRADPQGFAVWFQRALAVIPGDQPVIGVSRQMGHRFHLSAQRAGKTPARMRPEDRTFMTAQLDFGIEAALGYDYSAD